MATLTQSRRTTGDHFVPGEDLDPKAQRLLRAHLEQIDYTAYAANRAVVSGALTGVDGKKFEGLALASAQARARWVATGIAITDGGRAPTAAQVAELADLRTAYEELTEVYEAMRRLVERGYLEY